MPRALLAAYDKTGLVALAQGLVALDWELIATGGTERALRQAGIPVTSVAEVIKFPEILDGRVKTLHPAIHGGLLARRSDPGHLRQLAEHGITGIDLVANNLYPFEQAISAEGATLDDALENIDVGGPTMLRAAAKNFPDVVVLCNPADYEATLKALTGGGVPKAERRRLAAKAFQHVALYDTVIASYLRDAAADQPSGDLETLPRAGRGVAGGPGAGWPEELTIGLRKRMDMRYGENPHQAGALYAEAGVSVGIVAAKQLHGIELSFNNIMDADAAWRAATDFAAPTIAIIKHNTPCGLASHD